MTDPQGQPLTIRVDGIGQDEPTAECPDDHNCPDASGVGTSTAQVRAEREGYWWAPGDGRVYHIAFTATDPDGNTCNGLVTTCVPFEPGAAGCVDQGPQYDSGICFSP